MTKERYQEISNGDSDFTEEEGAEGWHFCWSRDDGLLIGPGMDEMEACTCAS